MELPISVDRKAVLAENTYLLTLDGDIDFQVQVATHIVTLLRNFILHKTFFKCVQD